MIRYRKKICTRRAFPTSFLMEVRETCKEIIFYAATIVFPKLLCSMAYDITFGTVYLQLFAPSFRPILLSTKNKTSSYGTILFFPAMRGYLPMLLLVLLSLYSFLLPHCHLPLHKTEHQAVFVLATFQFLLLHNRYI